MQTEFILWATRKGDASWNEQVILETTDRNELDRAWCWATQNGFINVRVMTWNGEKPDFTKVVNA